MLTQIKQQYFGILLRLHHDFFFIAQRSAVALLQRFQSVQEQLEPDAT